MTGNEIDILDNQKILKRIYTIRRMQVMLDSDLAELYNVETKVFNQSVKRNIERFPKRFRFKLLQSEFDSLRKQFINFSKNTNLRSQFVTSSSSDHGGRRYLPYVFTEQGVSMLSAVLRSENAVMISIQIMDAFVSMRKFLTTNAGIFQRLGNLEQKQLITATRLDEVFAAIEANDIKPKQGIFFDGQIYDAYLFVSNLIKSAKTSIVIIDNYVDESVLTLLAKRDKNCRATIYSRTISRELQLDLKKHNEQYLPIQIKVFKNSHDRFLILDERYVYHIGASLKDLGKKWFAFSLFYKNTLDILRRLESEE